MQSRNQRRNFSRLGYSSTGRELTAARALTRATLLRPRPRRVTIAVSHIPLSQYFSDHESAAQLDARGWQPQPQLHRPYS